ncbi:hypothetical protein F5Y16DRAFT_402107 [Xylariaceae sp. FL0255]|nr:hypothetical protein F5Y16DRAFT_402107 [Xylariaceae sp. FL0255]
MSMIDQGNAELNIAPSPDYTLKQSAMDAQAKETQKIESKQNKQGFAAMRSKKFLFRTAQPVNTQQDRQVGTPLPTEEEAQRPAEEDMAQHRGEEVTGAQGPTVVSKATPAPDSSDTQEPTAAPESIEESAHEPGQKPSQALNQSPVPQDIQPLPKQPSMKPPNFKPDSHNSNYREVDKQGPKKYPNVLKRLLVCIKRFRDE